MRTTRWESCWTDRLVPVESSARIAVRDTAHFAESPRVSNYAGKTFASLDFKDMGRRSIGMVQFFEPLAHDVPGRISPRIAVLTIGTVDSQGEKKGNGKGFLYSSLLIPCISRSSSLISCALLFHFATLDFKQRLH